MLAIEELSRADAGVGGHRRACTPAPPRCRCSPTARPSRSSGSCRRWRRATSSGAFALTEAGRARDAGAMRTRAGRGRPRLTGTKQWITNGSHAAHVPRLRARPRRAASQRVRRARGAPGLHGHARGGEARAELLVHRRPGLRGHARPSGSASRARACGSRWRRSTAAASGSPRRRSGIAQAALDVAAAYARGAPRVRRARSAASRRSSRSSPTCRPRSRRRAR